MLSGSGEPFTVTGVQFTVGGDKDGKVYEVKAKKEVVLSAGAFGTPQLLELSGANCFRSLIPLQMRFTFCDRSVAARYAEVRQIVFSRVGH